MLEMIVTETDETCNDVRDTIDIANQAIANDLNMLNTLLEDTNRIANESQMYRQVNVALSFYHVCTVARL